MNRKKIDVNGILRRLAKVYRESYINAEKQEDRYCSRPYGFLALSILASALEDYLRVFHGEEIENFRATGLNTKPRSRKDQCTIAENRENLTLFFAKGGGMDCLLAGCGVAGYGKHIRDELQINSSLNLLDVATDLIGRRVVYEHYEHGVITGEIRGTSKNNLIATVCFPSIELEMICPVIDLKELT